MKITADQRKKLLALNERVGFEGTASDAVTRWLKWIRKGNYDSPRRRFILPLGIIDPDGWKPEEALAFYSMLKSALGERLTPAYKRGFQRLLDFVCRSFNLSAVDLLADLADPEPGSRSLSTVKVQVGPSVVDLGVHAGPLLGGLLVTLRDVCEKLDVEPHSSVQVAFNAILQAQLKRRDQS